MQLLLNALLILNTKLLDYNYPSTVSCRVTGGLERIPAGFGAGYTLNRSQSIAWLLSQCGHFSQVSQQTYLRVFWMVAGENPHIYSDDIAA